VCRSLEGPGSPAGEGVESCTQAYRARRPEATALYEVMRDSLETLLRGPSTRGGAGELERGRLSGCWADLMGFAMESRA